MYIFKTTTGFGFTDTQREGAYPISDQNYRAFFTLQSQGKQFKLKDINSSVFEEIFEEVVPEPIPQEPSEIALLKAKNQKLEAQLTDTQLALVDVYELILGGQ